MSNKLAAILVLALLSGPAWAERVQSTTSVLLTFRNCVPGQTVCDDLGPIQAKEYAGLPGDPEAEASMDDPAFGASRGSVKITGVPGSAKMNTLVNSVAGARNGSSSFLLHRYINSSGHVESLTFSGVLNYDQTVPPSNAEFPNTDATRSGAFAEMLILTMNVDAFEAGSTAEDNFEMVMGETPAGVEYKELESKVVSGPANTTGAKSQEISGTVVIDPGDSVWILGILQSLGANGASVNARLNIVITVQEISD